MENTDCEEIWKSVSGYEGLYEVSNYGRVKALEKRVRGTRNCQRVIKEHLKKPTIAKNGYYIVMLHKYNQQKEFYVHRLVMEAFVANVDNKEYINHIDGVKTNNHLSNLEWCTPSENLYHAIRTGLMKRKRRIRCVETGEIFDSRNDAAKSVGLVDSCIYRSVKYGGVSGGYHWEYADNEYH